jgi:hypothetical protein
MQDHSLAYYSLTDHENTLMIHVTKDREKVVQQSSRRSYNTPRLFVYGAVRQLTASGSVDRPEGTGKGNAGKRP